MRSRGFPCAASPFPRTQASYRAVGGKATLYENPRAETPLPLVPPAHFIAPAEPTSLPQPVLVDVFGRAASNGLLTVMASLFPGDVERYVRARARTHTHTHTHTPQVVSALGCQ